MGEEYLGTRSTSFYTTHLYNVGKQKGGSPVLLERSSKGRGIPGNEKARVCLEGLQGKLQKNLCLHSTMHNCSH